jgi:hypothetical protein
MGQGSGIREASWIDIAGGGQVASAARNCIQWAAYSSLQYAASGPGGKRSFHTASKSLRKRM